MPLSTADINSLLSTWATNAPFISAHTAYSATGANEVAGGSYARVAVTWAGPSAASIALSGTPYSINIPASTTVEYVGFWSAITSGTFAGMFPGGNFSAFTFTAPSSSSTFLAPGSSYANGTTVVVFNTSGSTLPGGFSAGTIYFVISASSDSFQLSATSGGSAITVSADGSGIIQQIATEVFTLAGSYSVSGATVTGT